MTQQMQTNFSKRERQIMDIVYRFEKTSAREIHEAIPDAPSYTSIRSHLRAMVDKGYLVYSQEGIRYVYTAVVPKVKARSSALHNVLTNFFGGSHQDLVATLIDNEAKNLSDQDLEKLSTLIEKAKQEDR